MVFLVCQDPKGISEVEAVIFTALKWNFRQITVAWHKK